MTQLVLVLEALGSIFGDLGLLLLVIGGGLAGIILGATPGLTAVVGIVLLFPFSFHVSPLAAVAMMYALHKTAVYGGSITAILLNTPGTAAAACTQLDGYPLTLMGKSGKALRVAAVSSAIADFGSELVLIFATYHLAQLVWLFGPMQLAAVLFFALTLIAAVTGQSVVKGLLAAMLGMLLATVGLDPISGGERFVFERFELMDGLGLIPVLIGLFVVSEVFVQLEKRTGEKDGGQLAPPPKQPDDSRLTWKEFRSILPTIGPSFLIGQIIGVIPGLGAAVAPWVAYGQARSFSRRPEEFGRGALKGIASAESANNATSGANLIPLLTLGIPGSTGIAIIMAVFMVHGVQFGPRIFEQSPDLVYGVFASGLIAIALYFLVGFFLARYVGELVARIPIGFVYSLVAVISVAGTYSVQSSIFDIGVLVAFGILGYVLRKAQFPLPPLVIAFIIGGRFESSLRTALMITEYRLAPFLSDPFVVVVLMLTIVLLVWNVWRESSLDRTYQ